MHKIREACLLLHLKINCYQICRCRVPNCQYRIQMNNLRPSDGKKLKTYSDKFESFQAIQSFSDSAALTHVTSSSFSAEYPRQTKLKWKREGPWFSQRPSPLRFSSTSQSQCSRRPARSGDAISVSEKGEARFPLTSTNRSPKPNTRFSTPSVFFAKGSTRATMRGSNLGKVLCTGGIGFSCSLKKN